MLSIRLFLQDGELLERQSYDRAFLGGGAEKDLLLVDKPMLLKIAIVVFHVNVNV
jgi:hypothetical protein